MSLAKPFIVSYIKDPDQQGVAISQEVAWVPAEGGAIKPVVMIGVLWNEMRTPSPSFHPPEELAWENVPGVTDQDDEIDREMLASILTDKDLTSLEKLDLIEDLLDGEEPEDEEESEDSEEEEEEEAEVLPPEASPS